MTKQEAWLHEEIEKLRAYMQEHHLQPIGYAYKESLLEEMSTAESKNFLTRIALPVALAEK